jgi:leader peptidase (prepilin peptidase) / N-methyltransferase
MAMTGPWVIASAGAGVSAGPWLRAVIFGHSTAAGERLRRTCPTCGDWLRPAGCPLRGPLPTSGRCPSCRARVGPPRLAVELAAGAALAAVAARASSAAELAALGWLVMVAVPLAFIDVAVHRLPDRLTAAGYAGTLGWLAVTALGSHHPGQLGRATLAGAGLAALYLVICLASPASIGAGDGKLAASVGTALGWFGWRTLVSGTVACFVTAGLSAAALLALRRVRFGDQLPLGPFLLVGALLAIAL